MTASLDSLQTNAQAVLDAFIFALREFQNCFPQNDRFTVALSGGVDSIVLLDLFAKATQQNFIASKVNAIYIDHQLQIDSSKWGEFCEQRCYAYKIPFQVKRVTIARQARQGFEQLARKARYKALFEALPRTNGVLITAHHANDQAETLLLNLFRGAGVSGLASMKNVLETNKGLVFRPLLEIQKNQIENYAEFHQLEWVEDPSNKECEFRRNWIRNKVLPDLETVYPSIVKTFNQTAHWMQESEILLEKLASIQCQQLYENSPNEINHWGFPLPETIHEHSKERHYFSWGEYKNMFRFWVKSQQFPRLNESIFYWLFNTAYQTEEDGSIVKLKAPLAGDYLLTSGERWQLYQKSVFYLPAGNSISLNLKDFLSLKMDSTSKNYKTKLDIYVDMKRAEQLENIWLISLSQLSEDMQTLLNRKALKRYFQDNKIPVWQRSHWPFLVKNNSLTSNSQNPKDYELVGGFGSPKLIKFESGVKAMGLDGSVPKFLENYWQTQFCFPEA